MPQPNRFEELEALRLRTCLGEFAHHRTPRKRPMKQVRTKAARTRLKERYHEQDYQTMVDVGAKLP